MAAPRSMNLIADLVSIQALTSVRLHNEKIYPYLNSDQILKELERIKKVVEDVEEAECQRLCREMKTLDAVKTLFDTSSDAVKDKAKIQRKVLLGRFNNIFDFVISDADVPFDDFHFYQLKQEMRDLISDLEKIHKDLRDKKANSEYYTRISGDFGEQIELNLSLVAHHQEVPLPAYLHARQCIEEWQTKENDKDNDVLAADPHKDHFGVQIKATSDKRDRFYKSDLNEKTTKDFDEASFTAKVCASTIEYVNGKKEVVGHVEFMDKGVMHCKSVIMPKEIDPLYRLVERMSIHYRWNADHKTKVNNFIKNKYGNLFNRVFTEDDYKKRLTLLSRDQDFPGSISDRDIKDMAAYLAAEQKTAVKNPENYIYLFRQLESINAKGYKNYLQNLTSEDAKIADGYCKMRGFDYENLCKKPNAFNPDEYNAFKARFEEKGSVLEGELNRHKEHRAALDWFETAQKSKDSFLSKSPSDGWAKYFEKEEERRKATP